MKSVSASAPPLHKRWRLRRTLRRKIEYRPIEDDDVKYAYAAYKRGGIPGFDKSDLGPEEFKRAFEIAVISKCHAAWTVLAQTGKGFIPAGFIFAAWAPNAPFLIVSGGIWLPWASKRNIIEGTVGFLNGARREYSLMIYALPEHKRIYEVCMGHGIMRQVGTSHVAIPGKSTSVYETKTPERKAA